MDGRAHAARELMRLDAASLMVPQSDTHARTTRIHPPSCPHARPHTRLHKHKHNHAHAHVSSE